MWKEDLKNLDLLCISLLLIWGIMAQLPKLNRMTQMPKTDMTLSLKRFSHWTKTSFNVTYNVEDFEFFWILSVREKYLYRILTLINIIHLKILVLVIIHCTCLFRSFCLVYFLLNFEKLNIQISMQVLILVLYVSELLLLMANKKILIE